MIIPSSTTENVKSKVKKTQLNLQMVKNCLFLNCKKIVLVVFFCNLEKLACNSDLTVTHHAFLLGCISKMNWLRKMSI